MANSVLNIEVRTPPPSSKQILQYFTDIIIDKQISYDTITFCFDFKELDSQLKMDSVNPVEWKFQILVQLYAGNGVVLFSRFPADFL